MIDKMVVISVFNFVKSFSSLGGEEAKSPWTVEALGRGGVLLGVWLFAALGYAAL